ncbi:MAG: alpha/beta fold hydrolase [Chthoniobacterales bacterium]
MPAVDKPLEELQKYLGISPCPKDFDAFWDKSLAEQRATDPAVELIPSTTIQLKNTETFDLFFTGVGGSRVYAKYLRPKNSPDPHPAILAFHGYSGSGGEWQDYLSFVSEGYSVAVMDCRGQGGRSEDLGSVKGTTLRGHIMRGMDDSPEKLLFRQIFLDTAQLFRVVSSFDEVDETRIGSFGGSQGGALSVVCAALEPRIKRCVSLYPFLSDYKRVWEMGLDKNAYDDMRYYFMRFDPLHEREEEIFNRLGYIDIQNLAARIKAEVLMCLTLADDICPPSTQFATFNKIQSPKIGKIYPDYGHQTPPGFMDQMFNFFTKL